MLIFIVCLAAFVLGLISPIRWGVFGFVGWVVFLFLVQAGVNASLGFAGSSIEDSLILFNGSWLSYIGFNLQITYRAFAPVILALALPYIFRLARDIG